MQQPSVRALLRLTMLGALVGLPTGLLAFCFVALVHGLEHLLWYTLPAALGLDGPPWYLLLGLPTLGGLLVHFARRLPGDGGPSPLHTGLPEAGDPRNAFSVGLAALATLPFGLVLGPEAPLLALGAALAMWLTARAPLDAPGRGIVGASGATAAMSTLFGGPLVAGLMLLEGGAVAGLAIIPIMLPCLAAASVAFLLITGLGSWSGLPVAGLQLGELPRYEAVLVGDLLVAVLAGAVIGAICVLIGAVARRIDRLARRNRLAVLLAGGATVGALSLIGGGFGADPLDVLFSGQASLTPLLGAPALVVLVLGVTKAIAYAVSLGAGFRGGAIFPAIFLGVAVADVAVLAFGMSPTVAVAIGAAAGMAGTSGMLVAPVLFAGLLVGASGVETLPVAALAGITAWLTARWLEERTAPVDAPAPSAPDRLDRLDPQEDDDGEAGGQNP